MLKEFSFAFGDDEVRISLPQERVINIVEGTPALAITDVEAAVKEALHHPIGAPLLKDV
ncbi:MAG: hypothetical protein H7X79_11280, partial [Sporomusaceae bacterium]|nr:hypothetical protein [Sporomusaceae bacterium]